MKPRIGRLQGTVDRLGHVMHGEFLNLVENENFELLGLEGREDFSKARAELSLVRDGLLARLLRRVGYL
jgi:hypothetical protein